MLKKKEVMMKGVERGTEPETGEWANATNSF